MTKQIYCCKCKKYCGEIRDARLIKGLQYICDKCANDPIFDLLNSLKGGENG
jgi:predicted SprT family Zn-dependent metalloprotease